LIWLGDKRGNLSDWTTQQWVRTTGRQVSAETHPWLDGPAGGTRQIGKEFFAHYAATNNLTVCDSGIRGLIESFTALHGPSNDLSQASPAVREFYERTSEYDLDSWADWCGFFRPFGLALALLFSRRLQQLNVPLSALDSSRGMSSQVVQLRNPQTGRLIHTAWIRELHATKNVLYAGCYSICNVPGFPNPCIKVVFPLPNGNAIVLMRPEVHKEDGSFSVTSAGRSFGDPGFYFTLHDEHGLAWARYVRSMQETIRVYAAESGHTRADHILWIWGVEFLRLHYRMRPRA